VQTGIQRVGRVTVVLVNFVMEVVCGGHRVWLDVVRHLQGIQVAKTHKLDSWVFGFTWVCSWTKVRQVVGLHATDKALVLEGVFLQGIAADSQLEADYIAVLVKKEKTLSIPSMPGRIWGQASDVRVKDRVSPERPRRYPLRCCWNTYTRPSGIR